MSVVIEETDMRPVIRRVQHVRRLYRTMSSNWENISLQELKSFHREIFSLAEAQERMDHEFVKSDRLDHLLMFIEYHIRAKQACW